MDERTMGRKIKTGVLASLFIVLPLLVGLSGIVTAADDFTLKWTTTTGLNGYIGPVTKDINGDGIDEIFIAGLKNPAGPKGRIVCLNGATGNIVWAKDFQIGYVDYHVPIAIADLNNDGIYEIIHSADRRTVALYASNGTEFWNVSIPSGWHQFVIADIDGTGFPYVYVSDHDTDYGNGKISKIRGYDGALIAQTQIWKSCYGGVSAADVDGQGTFVIAVSDRNYGTGAKGARFYDKDLNLIYNDIGVMCSSHCISFIDIDEDGLLEAVTLQQSGGGIYVWKWNTGAQTYARYAGKCSNNLGLGCHTQPAVYDIDKDGRIELITCFSTYPKVWDLGTWSLDATLSDQICSEPPDIANVMGDSDLEIISCANSIKIYDSTYSLIKTIDIKAKGSLTQDIDNDGLNELILNRNNSISVYDTLAVSPTPRVRTDTPYYSERRTGAGVYVAPIDGSGNENVAPNIPSNPSPVNAANNQPITIDLSWSGGDLDVGDTVAYDVYFEGGDSTPDVLVSNDQVGTSYDPGVLNGGQTYYWKIIATDNHGASTIGPVWYFGTVTPPDTTPPTISGIGISNSNPIDTQLSFGWENFSAVVTDNVAVQTVRLLITCPDASTLNLSMTNRQGTTTYYCRTTLTSYGNYSHRIWARDTTGNRRTSSSSSLSKPPNWDINNDGQCNILDQVRLSSQYSRIGNSGWIREDVDNNGFIQILDFIYISNHYGETWWT